MDFSTGTNPIAITILLLTVATSVAAFTMPDFAMANVFEPYEVSRGRRLHTLITGNLIHANLGHLAFNLISFYFFAFPLERVIGSVDFLIVYLSSMLIADIPSLVKHRNNPEYRTLGASGAVSGVIFSMILFFPTMRMGLFLFPPIIPAWLFGPLYLGYSVYASRTMSDNINHDAHIWGAFGGIITTIVIIPEALKIFASAMGWI